jgi:hypothetical protein
VNPIHILITIYILGHAYDNHHSDLYLTIADMIVIAFYFLLRPGEYMGTTTDDTHFRLHDAGLYIGGRNLDTTTVSMAELNSTTSASYKFTTQTNRTRDEKLVQGRKSIYLCCPVKATIQRFKHHHHHLQKSKQNAPIAAYYRTNWCTAIKPKDITDVLHQAMTANYHRVGVSASEYQRQILARWWCHVDAL